MPWEEFDKHIAQKPTEPMASITTRGIFSFNSASYEALGEPKAVTLLFDRENRRMGLRPADPSSPTAYTVRRQPNSKTYNISLMKFANFYGIPTDGKRYNATIENNVLVVDIGSQEKPQESEKDSEASEFDNMPF